MIVERGPRECFPRAVRFSLVPPSPLERREGNRRVDSPFGPTALHGAGFVRATVMGVECFLGGPDGLDTPIVARTRPGFIPNSKPCSHAVIFPV